jgi:2-haloalkanoic acid dehalogenase type II
MSNAAGQSGPLAAALREVDTLTFDCYGTLIDWRLGLQNSFRELFGSQAESKLAELFAAYVETEAQLESGPYVPYREILATVAERLARRFSLELAAGGGANLAASLPKWKPFADTNAALCRLKDRFRLGVLSNIDRDLFADTARHFPITFDFVVTAEDVRGYKPGPGHFQALLGRHPELDKVLHVAQSLYHDGRACLRHGLAFAWINRYNDPRDTAVPMLAEFADLRSFAHAVCG